MNTPTTTILQGDWIEQLRTLPDNSVHCCVTSPPYWSLRDYGVAGQLGLESTPQEYVSKLVAGFREVRRVLREDGTLWLNLGDSYAAQAGQRKSEDARGPKQCSNRESCDTGSRHVEGLKPKDLVGIPWMVAFALRADGWFLRQWMPWVKRNPMPESCQDRPVVSCEMFFLLTKSQTYFYDAEAVKLPGSMALLKQIEEGYNGKATKDFSAAGAQDASAVKSRIIAGHRRTDKQRGHSRKHDGFNDRWDAMEKEEQCSGWRSTRNSDWFFESIGGMILNHDLDPLAFVVNPAGFAGSHFATFPPDLVKPCILAGTSARGCCQKCGAPWEREVNRVPSVSKECPKTQQAHEARGGTGIPIGTVGKSGSGRINGYTETLGWFPSCRCNNDDYEVLPVPCTVLDPFGGSGTVGQVALELGRNATLIELNPDYISLIRERINVTPSLPLA